MSDVDVAAFRRDGWLVVPGAINSATLDGARCRRRATRALGRRPAGRACTTSSRPTPARCWRAARTSSTPTRAFGELLRGGIVVEILGELFGDEPVLFKEKINYKQPGGGGFAPHQDAAAYRFVDHHISCMVPLDPATPASGCLYVAPGFDAGQLPTDQRGRIEDATAAQLDWRAVPLEPGDLLFFDSYTPHHSDTNTTERPRRAAYLTYNAASLGDHRERYYADKRAEFERAGDDFDGERVRISISDDFLGRPVQR